MEKTMKSITRILMLALSLVLVISLLASCGGDGTDGEEDGDGEEVEYTGIPKEAWEEAFVFDNVTMAVTEKAYYGTMLYQSVDFELYFIDGGEGFDKDGISQGNIVDYIAYFAFKASFDKFKHNPATDEYTCSYITVDSIIYENVVIKFTEDNKLKSVAFDSDSSYLTYKITADFTNYATTEKPERAPFEPVGDEFCSYFNTRELEGRNLAYITIKVKDYGDIKLVLDATTAPVTVAHFLKLISEGFYDGLSFHRVLNEFMIQGGDPEANGSGDYKDADGNKVTIKGEFSSNGHENDILHLRGVISMARGNDKDSASCQFFICNADSDWLDGNYAAFGYVIDGMSVVDHITYDTMIFGDSNGTIADKTKQAVIESITIDELIGIELGGSDTEGGNDDGTTEDSGTAEGGNDDGTSEGGTEDSGADDSTDTDDSAEDGAADVQ